jgi:hypothetical protein
MLGVTVLAVVITAIVLRRTRTRAQAAAGPGASGALGAAFGIR